MTWVAIDISGSVYTLRFYSAPGLITSTSGASDDAAVVQFVSIPTQIAYVRGPGRRVNMGLGYFVPGCSSASACARRAYSCTAASTRS